MSTPYKPAGFRTITPYLIVADADALADFLRKAFDAEEKLLMRNPQGLIMHACFQIGDSLVELANSNDKWPALPAGLHVYFPDVDAAYAQAIAAGGTSLYEPTDMFYGERSGGVQDPSGNQWYLATFQEELTVDEINQRAAEWEKKCQS